MCCHHAFSQLVINDLHNWYRNEEGKLKGRKYEKIKKRGKNSD